MSNIQRLYCSYCDCALSSISFFLLLSQSSSSYSSSCCSALQASLRPEPHQQPAGQAEHSAAPALHSPLCALLHPVVGRQTQQLLQLRHLMERPPANAGNATHPCCRKAVCLAHGSQHFIQMLTVLYQVPGAVCHGQGHI